jgi:hypothetical protein
MASKLQLSLRLPRTQPPMDCRLHVYLDSGRVAVCGRGGGSVLATVVGWSMSAAMTAQLVTDALVMAIWRRGKPDALMHHSDRGSQYTSGAIPAADDRSRRHLLNEPLGQRLGQCCHGELLLVAQNRADRAEDVQEQRRGQGRRVRLYRAVLQSETPAFDDRISKPYGVRAQSRIRLSRCHPNRVRAT